MRDIWEEHDEHGTVRLATVKTVIFYWIFVGAKRGIAYESYLFIEFDQYVLANKISELPSLVTQPIHSSNAMAIKGSFCPASKHTSLWTICRNYCHRSA